MKEGELLTFHVLWNNGQPLPAWLEPSLLPSRAGSRPGVSAVVPALQEWGLLAALPDRGVWLWSLALSMIVRDGRGPTVEVSQYMVCLVRALGWR